ncbi:hypothetical protein BJX99DRAFT_160283 [Aspergillus californicus]
MFDVGDHHTSPSIHWLTGFFSVHSSAYSGALGTYALPRLSSLDSRSTVKWGSIPTCFLLQPTLKLLDFESRLRGWLGQQFAGQWAPKALDP